jgi:hypothetical protein
MLCTPDSGDDGNYIKRRLGPAVNYHFMAGNAQSALSLYEQEHPQGLDQARNWTKGANKLEYVASSQRR